MAIQGSPLTLEYHDISNDQRQIIYQQRNELMASDSIADNIMRIRHDVLMDVKAPTSVLQAALNQAVEKSFNRITVDSDTSTIALN